MDWERRCELRIDGRSRLPNERDCADYRHSLRGQPHGRRARLFITTVYLSCDAPGAQPTNWHTFTSASCNSNGQGNVASVRLIYTYQPFTPVIGGLIGNVVRQGAATMVIN